MKLEKNSINPRHYQYLPNSVECIDVCEYFCFNKGNAIKYVFRSGVKDPSKEVEDLQKAIWYLKREIKRIESGKTKQKNIGE